MYWRLDDFMLSQQEKARTDTLFKSLGLSYDNYDNIYLQNARKRTFSICTCNSFK